MPSAAVEPTSRVLTSAVPFPGEPAPGRYRVLVLSTLGFTLMFAVWLEFGILGLPIKQEFGLSDTAFYWLTALPVLNGSIWRLATGVLADRLGGRLVFSVMLAHKFELPHSAPTGPPDRSPSSPAATASGTSTLGVDA